MKPSLQFRLSQHMALTPQLQQSIRLLQLSTLELHQEIEQMLDQNPFLEPEDEGLGWESAHSEAESVRGERDQLSQSSAADGEAGGGSDDASGGDADPAGLDQATPGATERSDWENGTESEDFDGIGETPSRNGDGDEFDPISRSTASQSLADFLRQQLRGMRLSAQDAAAVEVLIESLNDDGYLADSLEEIAQSLLPEDADEDAHDEMLSKLRCGLGWLQSLEPNGVGARDLSQCLCLQLRHLEHDRVWEVAMAICEHHLELLARRDVKRLMQVTGASEGELRQAQALIVSLEPKPGRAFSRAEANIVVPDVIVVRAGRGWRAQLNADVMPKLRINDLYAQALRSSRAPRGSAASESHQALSSRLQEARWFVKNVQQRFETILRVSQAIVDRQKNFFSHGAIAMKPLVLREIADELGLHESTISRVTTAKYMLTPYGTFELKYFFGSSLQTEAGGNASSTAVRALIKQLVAAEDPAKPLSDSQLASMLEEQGIQVARRTVAKYREALKIAPANLRKSI